jgi:hypothetical protein
MQIVKINNWFNLDQNSLDEIVNRFEANFDKFLENLSLTDNNDEKIEKFRENEIETLYLRKVAQLVYTKLHGSTFIEL